MANRNQPSCFYRKVYLKKIKQFSLEAWTAGGQDDKGKYPGQF